MRDIDPQLMRLREIEARLALCEFHLREQEELVEQLQAQGFDALLAIERRETILLSLGTLQQRQALLVGELRPCEAMAQTLRLRPPAIGTLVSGVEFHLRQDALDVRGFVVVEVLVERFGARENAPDSWMRAFLIHEPAITAAAVRRHRQRGGPLVVVTWRAFRD